MIRSPAFIREEDEVDLCATQSRAMVAGIPQSHSWHSLSSFSLSKSKKQSPSHDQPPPQQRQPSPQTSSASSSRSNSGKSSGYASSISTTPAHHLTVRPRSNTASPTTSSASPHACRRCGTLLCRWRKTHHNIVVCGAGGVGKSALLVQYLTHRFIYDYDPTLEESYHSFLALDGCCAELDITELAGQNMTESAGLFRSKVLNADGFIVVYDITDASTLAEAERTINTIQRELLAVPSPSPSNRSSTSDCGHSVTLSPQLSRDDQHRAHLPEEAASPPPVNDKFLSSTSPVASRSPQGTGSGTEGSDSSTPTARGESPDPGAANVASTHVIPVVQIDKSNARSRGSLDLLSTSASVAVDFPPIILLGNKCDLESERQVATRDARSVSLETGCYFDEASARCGHEDVDRVMAMLVQIMRQPNSFRDDAEWGARSPTTSGARSLSPMAPPPPHAFPAGRSSIAALPMTSLTMGRGGSGRAKPRAGELRRTSQPNIYSIDRSGGGGGGGAGGGGAAWLQASDLRSKTLSPNTKHSSRYQWWLRTSLRSQLVRFQTKLKAKKAPK